METNNKLKIKGRHEVSWIRDNRVIKTEIIENIVVDIGLQTMFQRMSGEYEGNLLLNKALLGTGTNVVAESDTKLQTETYRNDIISCTAEDNVLYVDAFFTALEVNGTFKEFGYVIDGTGTVDTGYLFNRANVDWVKTNLDSLFIRSTFTIENA